jgi:hypothetical protein
MIINNQYFRSFRVEKIHWMVLSSVRRNILVQGVALQGVTRKSVQSCQFSDAVSPNQPILLSQPLIESTSNDVYREGCNGPNSLSWLLQIRTDLKVHTVALHQYVQLQRCGDQVFHGDLSNFGMSVDMHGNNPLSCATECLRNCLSLVLV